MPRGGKRERAGRPTGSPNKATAQRQAEIAASGVTPLDYLLAILRDESQSQEVRMDAAVRAAPYVHARLQAVDAKVNLHGKQHIHVSWMTEAEAKARGWADTSQGTGHA